MTAVAQGSIRRRLFLSLLASAAVLAVAVYLIVLSVARQVARESQDNVLTASALSILDSARFSGGQLNVDLPYAALSMLDSVSDERVFYAIRLDEEFLSGYPDLPLGVEGGAGSAAFLSDSFKGAEVRIATLRRSVSTDIGQRFLSVSVAQTLSGQQQVFTRISRLAMAIGAGFFILSALVAAIIARSTIRPLDRLTASVSRRGPRDLRPVAAPVPSEMVPLVASLNNLMGRLQTSLTRSEDFIAEAAHRVRTPLAIVRTRAEVIERKTTDPDIRSAVGEMIHAIDDSSRTAGQLLDHAMVTFRLDDMARQPIDLPQLVRDTVDRLRPVSDLKSITITLRADAPLRVQGDPIVLQNAVLNVLDNALKYAPAGAEVTVDVSRQGDTAELRVADTGPGFPPGDLDALTDRFARGDNAQGVVGSGLGLTIVKEVIEAHGGHMSVGNLTGGGACVRLFFPLS